VKLVKVNGIEPSAENIISGRYIIARPLLLVTRGLPQGKTERFIDFMLSREGQAIVGKNFVPARR
jgi:phosphate transport system substrate-binding protein